jgi:glycosyltransferase involved in cell wall biosynthesis
MRIGLNLLYLLPGVVGGTETYAAGLLAGLAKINSDDEFIVFVNREAENWPLPGTSNFTRIVCPVRAVSRARRYCYEQLCLPRLIRAHGVDLVHSLGFVAPLFLPCPSVLTVCDIVFRTCADQIPLVRRLPLRFFTRQSVLRAKSIITISNFACSQIALEFGIPLAKITVTHLADSAISADDTTLAAAMQRYGIKRPYIIAFSSFSPHKNIPRLLQAFTRAQRDYKLPHQLVLLGHGAAGERKDTQTQDVIFTGFVDGASKYALLKGADLLVFPSTYEGFGLPVLEAQKVGVPVVCSKAASLPEVAGEAAIYFDPLSIDAMAKAIGQVVLNPDLQKTLIQSGLQNAAKFSWEQTARLTLEVYRKTIKY